MLTNPSSPASYNTIEEIQLRKSLLQKDMLKDDGKIRNQWHSLFSPPAALSKNASRAKRINSLLNTGRASSTPLCLDGNYTENSRDNG